MTARRLRLVHFLAQWPIVSLVASMFCTHENVRCTHGDEIVHVNFRRRVCLDCGKPLKGPLPTICWYTNEVHR